MTTRRALERKSRAVARNMQRFDLTNDDYPRWIYQNGFSQVFYYSESLGERVEAHPEFQGNPHSETISDMIRQGYLAPANGRFVLTPRGQQTLLAAPTVHR